MRTRPRVERPPGTDPAGILLSFPVAPEQAGLRLDHFIQSRIPRLSRTKAQAIVKACAYRQDGSRRRASERVRAGEVVILVRPSFEEPIAPQHFEIVYEDAAVLAVNKPAGLPVHPSATYHKHTLTWLLRQRFGDDAPQIAHRLDRETSGLLLCARTREAERKLKMCFETRQVNKRYLAIVQGQLHDERGTISVPMDRAREGLHILMEARNDGKPAETEYRVVARRAGATLVMLEPHTGRQHQLRIHMAALGHPIVGDKLYGPGGVAPFMEFIETGMTPALQRRLGHCRQALHAYELEIAHPDTDELTVFRAPLAADLQELWGEPVHAHFAEPR